MTERRKRMNIGELKSEIMGLAFEEPVSMQEYQQIVPEAINRSIGIIHTTVRPITASYKIVQDGSRAGMLRYPMKELVPDFMGFSGEFELERKGKHLTVFPYEIVDRDILLLDGAMDGTYRVWYRKKPARITGDTPETEELELAPEVQVLVPLLCSYYVWLDDDERKAVMYYNQYDDLKQQILLNTQKRPLAVMEGGMRW